MCLKLALTGLTHLKSGIFECVATYVFIFRILNYVRPPFVTAQQYIWSITGEEPGAVSAVSGHHVTLPSGTQDDAELPQYRQRATHYERGDLRQICLQYCFTGLLWPQRDLQKYCC